MTVTACLAANPMAAVCRAVSCGPFHRQRVPQQGGNAGPEPALGLGAGEAFGGGGPSLRHAPASGLPHHRCRGGCPSLPPLRPCHAGPLASSRRGPGRSPLACRSQSARQTAEQSPDWPPPPAEAAEIDEDFAKEEAGTDPETAAEDARHAAVEEAVAAGVPVGELARERRGLIHEWAVLPSMPAWVAEQPALRYAALGACTLLAANVLLAVAKAARRTLSPQYRRQRTVNRNQLVVGTLAQYLPGNREGLAPGVLGSLRFRTGAGGEFWGGVEGRGKRGGGPGRGTSSGMVLGWTGACTETQGVLGSSLEVAPTAAGPPLHAACGPKFVVGAHSARCRVARTHGPPARRVHERGDLPQVPVVPAAGEGLQAGRGG